MQSAVLQASTRGRLGAGQAIGKPEKELAPLRARAAGLLDYGKLKALHWDASAGTFLDWGVHTEDVALKAVQPNPQEPPVRFLPQPPPPPGGPMLHRVRVV